jgi:glucose/arabinose dehydrogenase
MVCLIRHSSRLALLFTISSAAFAQPFKVDTVARAPFSQFPVRIAFAPDGSGRTFFTERIRGRVRTFHRALLPDPFVSLRVESDGEQGMLSVAVHPRYPREPYLYVLYIRTLDRSLVVERYRDSSGTGVDPRLILVVPRLDGDATHVGGAMAFGPDGKLYVSVGDFGTRSDDAQDISTRRNYYGKILRLNDDGSVPPDNPSAGRSIWSFGHRNVRGITFDAVTGEMYCTENGSEHPNSVNRVPRGANMGWPDPRENAGNRLYEFAGAEQPGLTGILLYRGHAFPRLRGKLLFGGYAATTVWVADPVPAGGRLQPEPFFRTNAGFADIAAGPEGAIYLVNGPYVSSRILRLVPVAPMFTSEPPASATEDVEYSYTPAFSGTPPEVALIEGPAGMRVDTLSWTVRWTPSNVEAKGGFHSVTVRARNGAGYADQSFTIRVNNVNDPPRAARLLLPQDGETIAARDTEPEVTFVWRRGEDDDGDSVMHVVEIDTLASFSSGALRRLYVGQSDSLRLVLPRIATAWVWRVLVSDGTQGVPSEPGMRRLMVTLPEPSIVAGELRMTGRVVPPAPESPPVTPPAERPASAVVYSVSRRGPVRISVVNILGQEVAVPFNGEQSEGTYAIDVGNAGLPAGIYFARIQTPEGLETKKVVLSR